MNAKSRNIIRFVPALAFAGTVLVGGSVIARQRHHAPTGPDAFLNYQVDSTDELVNELKKNPTLRKRYAKHFGIPESEVVDWAKRALVPHTLPARKTMTVYGVTKTGRIYPVKSVLKKGTKVWATRSGVPVLKWACANPMTKQMPGTRLPSAPRSAGAVGNAPGGQVNLLGLAPEAGIAVAEAGPSIAAPVGGAGPLLQGGGGDVALGFPGLAGVSVPGPSGGGGGTNLGPLALLPLAFLFNQGNNGDTSTVEQPGITLPGAPTPILPPGGTTVVPPPPAGESVDIPEPGTVALLLMAAPVGVVAVIRRRKRG